MHRRPSRALALAESLLATLIWASSFVFVKMVLGQIGPLTTAGLRYFLGGLLLLPFLKGDGGEGGQPLRAMPARLWLRLGLLGLSAYTIGNGAFFLGLQFLSATATSFLSSLSPVLILFAGALWLKEVPSRVQVAGLAVSLAGSALFFWPGLAGSEALGLGIVAVGIVGFALFAVLGRAVARDREAGTVTLTMVPLAVGGGLLLAIALPLEGLPAFTPSTAGIVVWLAVVNTALAYMLYNHSLQVLTALEMNALLNLSPLGTAALAWLVLGEGLGWAQLVGMLIVIVGVTMVQWRSAA